MPNWQPLRCRWKSTVWNGERAGNVCVCARPCGSRAEPGRAAAGAGGGEGLTHGPAAVSLRQGAARCGRGANRRWSAARRCWGWTRRTCAAAWPRASCSPRQGAPKERSSSESRALPAGSGGRREGGGRRRTGGSEGEGETGRDTRGTPLKTGCPGLPPLCWRWAWAGAGSRSARPARPPRAEVTRVPNRRPRPSGSAAWRWLCPASYPRGKGKNGLKTPAWPFASMCWVAVSVKCSYLERLLNGYKIRVPNPRYYKNMRVQKTGRLTLLVTSKQKQRVMFFHHPGVNFEIPFLTGLAFMYLFIFFKPVDPNAHF